MRVALGGSLTRPKAALPPIIIGSEEAFLLRFVTMTQKTNEQTTKCASVYSLSFIHRVACFVSAVYPDILAHRGGLPALGKCA